MKNLKFKVGDIVRVVNPIDLTSETEKGNVYKVYKLRIGNSYMYPYDCKSLMNGDRNKYSSNYFYEEELEKIPDNESFVYLI